MIDDREEAPELDLLRLAAVLRRRVWIVAAAVTVCVGAAALYVATARPVYRATALLLIEKEERDRAVAPEGSMVESTADDYYQTQYRLLSSRSLLKTVLERKGIGDAPDFSGPRAVDSLRGALKISPVLRSRLVEVSVDSHDRELAALAANTLCEDFVRQNVENKLFISRELLQTLSVRGPAARVESGYESLPAVVNNPLIQQLKGQYASLEARMGEISRRYTPEHPERVRLQSEMNALRARITEETDKIVASLKAGLSGQLTANNIRIVDPAEPPRSPYRPRKTMTLALGLLAGLGLGAALALLVDSIDDSLRTPDEAKLKLGLPSLGSVPAAEGFEGSLEAYHAVDGSLTSESFKTIRTMIGFAAAGREARRLLVSSTVQGEGKTFVAINLAQAFSQLGERVLLVEGDLRRPSLHRRLALSRERGLSHFLAHAKEGSDAEGLIQTVTVPGLDALVCGEIPPNPSELLSLPRLKLLLDWAAQRYDRVVIDGTPVFPIADAHLWGRETDATLFVVQHGSIKRAMAANAVEQLRQSGMRLLGFVLNRVPPGGDGYYDYYYARAYRENAKERATKAA